MKISTTITVFISSLAATTTSAYTVNTPPSSSATTRRQAFQKTATLFGLGVASATILPPTPNAQAQDLTCPPKSNNCVNAKWVPPSGTSKEDAVSELIAVVKAYPQEGQNEVDGGGWEFVKGYENGENGLLWTLYRSSGKGFFAKAFNGGKPFVDDLALGIGEDGAVTVKSASRVGDSDFGVNQKRVDYLAAGLKAKGWTI